MKKNSKKRFYFKVISKTTFLILFFMIVLLIIPLNTSAQTDTVQVPSDLPLAEGNLNAAVKNAVDAGKLSNTIFLLESNGYYVLTDSILVPAGEHLTMITPEPGNTQETAPPQIRWTANDDVNRSYFFLCYGDLTLKNVWLLCADTEGTQLGACIIFRDNPLEMVQHKCNFDGVIIDYFPITTLAGGSVTVACKNFKGTFKNSYWKNCTDQYYRYYGRAVSFPYLSTGYHVDSLTFDNCTFSNIGYVYMQEEGEYGDNVHFNHCTFHNVVMYTLESGWWYNMSVTNSIFLNTYMFGHIPAYSSSDGGEPDGGTIQIDSIANFGFDVPVSEQDRHILFTNNSYFIEDWLSDWMQNNSKTEWHRENGYEDMIPVPQPMMNSRTITFLESESFPYMNKAFLYDSTDPGFVNAPTNIDTLKEFLLSKWWSGPDWSWAWKPENSINRLWPLEENMAYTNDTLLTAGMGGFPLGDLYHWFPDEYEQWKVQENNEKARINQWLETGNDPGVGSIKDDYTQKIKHFTLDQNYPNPFNPTTQIKYSVPKYSYISLKVYNQLGQEVTTISEGYRQAGTHEVTFDGTGLASGVYFYRITASNPSTSSEQSFVETKKLLLVK